MEDYKKKLQIEVHNIVDRLQNGLIHPYTAKQEIFKSTLKAINYTHSCKSDSELLPNMTLEQAIEKAKTNMDKIKDVDKHIDNIR